MTEDLKFRYNQLTTKLDGLDMGYSLETARLLKAKIQELEENPGASSLDQLNKAEVLLKEIIEMRSLQNQFFKTRKTEVLHQSKAKEKRVDQLLKQYFTKSEQPTLFQ